MFKKTILLLAIAISLISCRTREAQTDIDLSTGWEFSELGKNNWLPATVPGSVHTDLLHHGLIPNPMVAYNEDSLRRLEGLDWEYRHTFTVEAATLDKVVNELVFDGLDTYAEVYLNDSLVILADNMFVPWQANVQSLLREGENSLRVIFRSAVNRGLQKAAALPYRLQISNENNPDSLKTRPFTRKAPFHFGWDWGPRIVTCGIWRPVYLRSYSSFLASDPWFRPDTISSSKAVYTFEVDVKALAKGKASVYISIPEAGVEVKKKFEIAGGDNTLKLPVEIVNPRLWWPNGYGEAWLYKVTIEVTAKGQKQVFNEMLGVRSLRLVQEPDSGGRSFYFEVNGVPVFAKGANYIPSRTVTTEVTDSMYDAVTNDAVLANMNMLRVWGGAIYENDVFYRLCDQKGILVWQDFMFACEMNPGDEAHLANIRKEAEYNVKRLRKFSCMALWAGNNENLRAWHEWGWKEKYPKELSDSLFRVYEAIFHQILPQAVQDFHPGISYWGTSPGSYPGGTVRGDRRSGDEHDWNIWFGRVTPFEDFEANVPRFVSEYGLQSYPEMAAWNEVATPSDLSFGSPFFRYRQRSFMPWIAEGFDGNDMIMGYIRKYLGEPANFESYTYLSQVVQAIGLQMGIDIHRRNRPHTMGSLYWQINDCWPTMSWATVDYYGQWKAAHYAVRSAFAKVAISVKMVPAGMELFLISDSINPIKGELLVRVSGFEGENDTLQTIPVDLPALTSAKLVTIPMPKAAAGCLADIRLESGSKVLASRLATFAYLKDISLPKPSLSYSITADSLPCVVVKSDVYAPYIRLECKQAGRFSDNYFSLAPGTERVIDFVPAKAGVTIRKEDVVVQSMSDFKK